VKPTPSSSGDDRGLADDAALLRALANISITRAQVSRSLLELQHELSRALDWREWIRIKPVLAMSLAFGLGFLLGRRL
jgi:hypothetical protein